MTMDFVNSTQMFGHPDLVDMGTCGGYFSPDLKAGRQRPRLSSAASTVAPSSAALSFAASPAMSPEISISPAEPFFMDNWDFMLPAAEKSSDEEVPVEPVSRVASPAHKVARLEGSYETSESATAAEALAPGSPMTPRAALGSPRTPPSRTRAAPRSSTPPPLIPKSKRPRPPLLQALQAKSIDAVRETLLLDPTDATFPFWEHDYEPPLCCAVRLECIVKLLLEHEADPTATDKYGCTPLKIVQKKLVPQNSVPTSCEPVWMPPTMYAHFLPTFQGATPFDRLPTYASANEAWCQEVSSLLEGR